MIAMIGGESSKNRTGACHRPFRQYTNAKAGWGIYIAVVFAVWYAVPDPLSERIAILISKK